MATDGAWLPLVDVLAHVGVEAASEQADAVDAARLAAAAHVERVRPDLLADDGVTYAAGADVKRGAVLLAARLHARKGSPTGVASYGEFGPAAVLRYDSDIERLLGVGRYARPRVG